MARLGSRKRPAIVRVQSMSRAEEILSLCDEHGWQVIVGVEPEDPEDTADVERLLAGDVSSRTEAPPPRERVGRNEPCPCGSGRKFKRCCEVRGSHPYDGESVEIARRDMFVPIKLEDYVDLSVEGNPGTERRDVAARLREALAAHRAGVRCDCGAPIWVIGSAEAGLGCFTCLTGESTPDNDYEIVEACVPRDQADLGGRQARHPAPRSRPPR